MMLVPSVEPKMLLNPNNIQDNYPSTIKNDLIQNGALCSSSFWVNDYTELILRFVSTGV